MLSAIGTTKSEDEDVRGINVKNAKTTPLKEGIIFIMRFNFVPDVFLEPDFDFAVVRGALL